MSFQTRLTASRDKLLFTPGPLTTSSSVKQAMLHDLGSRDVAFIEIIRDIRRRLVELAQAGDAAFTAILMQGSGTFGIESVISSVIPPNGKLLVIVNGAYGRRMVQMTEILKIPCTAQSYPENECPVPEQVARQLAEEPDITHVAVVHCETTTGILNPVEEIGSIVREAGKQYIVDAMSSFGAVPLNVVTAHIDYLISSANKCIEGVPGFAFIIAREALLHDTEGWARSLSLDLLAQWRGLEGNGQFRFTPPTHALLAFHQALLELEAEGGVEGRATRYHQNHKVLMRGMREMGFVPYLSEDRQSHIITTFHYPPDFDFADFYTRLSQRGYLIYPGKVTHADCFRIGTIGRIFPHDVEGLLAAIRAVL